MSALASLVNAYDRLALRGEAPAFGYSQERIGFLIPLNGEGTPAGPPIDLRQGTGKKKTARMMSVPASFKRPGITPRSFFLWDNTAFVLGVTASEGKDAARRLEAFRERHKRDLAGTADEGLQALLRFIDWWTPESFAELGWLEEMKDRNLVFALESERLDGIHIHDRPAARELWARLSAGGDKDEAACLVTGAHAPVARLHPAIKGVWGAQTAGASIVSFNLDAFTSYGHEQGDNAPVSEAAAFAYTTALNRFLEKGSGHRLQIGDASTVFWADATDHGAALDAEMLASGLFNADERSEAGRVGAILAKIRSGRPIESVLPEVPRGVRFFVLGLAPNAARLSVRFYLEDDFGVIAERYPRHLERMRIDPPPKEEAPPMWRMLIETATLRKTDNIQPNLAGEWMRAILTDTPYPLTLLSTLIMRLRADGDVNALRVAMLKSIVIKNFNVEAPVSLDLTFNEKGYLLGRLFAVYEQIQTAALGRKVNANIKDKFYGAASAQPRKVFPLLDKGAAPHLSKVGKEKPGYKVVLERLVSSIMETMSPGEDPFPASLPDKQQGLFALGYYHQRNDFFRKPEKSAPEETPK